MTMFTVFLKSVISLSSIVSVKWSRGGGGGRWCEHKGRESRNERREENKCSRNPLMFISVTTDSHWLILN